MYEKCSFKENLEVLCGMSLRERKTSEETLKSAVTFCFFFQIHSNMGVASTLLSHISDHITLSCSNTLGGSLCLGQWFFPSQNDLPLPL